MARRRFGAPRCTRWRSMPTRGGSRSGRSSRASSRASLRSAEEERARRLDFLEFQLQELDGEELDAREVAALESDHRRLTHAERLGEEMARVAGALGGGDEPSAGESAEGALAIARRSLAAALRMDPSLEEFSVRLETRFSMYLRDTATPTFTPPAPPPPLTATSTPGPSR